MLSQLEYGISMNCNFPLVSVIIPTHNRPEALVRAIQSVVHQTYTNLEIIIVDDSSSYDVEEIIRKESAFQSCRVIVNTRTPGAAGARNTGFYDSNGALIAFLDDDDEWLPEKIVKQVEAVHRSRQEVGIVWTKDIIVRENGRIVKNRKLEGDVYKDLCRHHIAGNTSNPLIKRHVLDDVGPFDEDLSAAQDTELWIRIAKKYLFTTVDEPLALIYQYGSDRITTDRRKQLQGAYSLLRKHWREFPLHRNYSLIKRIIRISLVIIRDKWYGRTNHLS